MLRFMVKTLSKVRVPVDLRFAYCTQKKQLTFLSNAREKSLVVPFKIFFKEIGGIYEIYVTDFVCKTLLKKSRKTRDATLSRFFAAKVKQAAAESVQINFYSRIRFVGVGYKGITFADSPRSISIKLGYSHFIYYRLPWFMGAYSSGRFTEVKLSGSTGVDGLCTNISRLRQLRSPEPYKGKGVLRRDERIPLKIGKRV